jgi:hypothetical protein
MCVCVWIVVRQKRDETEQAEAKEDLKNEVMAAVESHMAACRQALSAALDECTHEIRKGVTAVITPDTAEVCACGGYGDLEDSCMRMCVCTHTTHVRAVCSLP